MADGSEVFVEMPVGR
uniref:Uncharacterized protein n=1 Tax=Rhizophora mucronata TaxID=61149 RepID=A0A2P2LG19_RHIMU